jgi:hypothetical protein
MKVSPAVSAVGRRGRQHRGVCCRLAGGGVRGKIPHPSPVIVVVLCSDDDASHRPPPLLSCPRPPPTSCARTLLPPLSLCRPMPALVAARAMTLSSPSSSSPSSRHVTSSSPQHDKNVHPCKERHHGASAGTRDAVSNRRSWWTPCPPHPCALPYAPSQQHVECHFPN